MILSITRLQKDQTRPNVKFIEREKGEVVVEREGVREREISVVKAFLLIISDKVTQLFLIN